MRRHLFLGLALLACASPAQPQSEPRPQDGVLGLLELPDVFGRFPCDRFTPREVRLFASPDSTTPVGEIRVDTYWTFPSEGGCTGLVVGVHRVGGVGAHRDETSGASATPLPTREYGYETEGAIVLQRRGAWFRIRLDDGAAWIHVPEPGRFHSLERLLTENLTYFAGVVEDRLTAAAGGHARDVNRGGPAQRVEPGAIVRVTDFQRIGGRLWVHIEVLSHSPCEWPDEPAVTARGWLPAHNAAGEPTIWYHSRGC